MQQLIDELKTKIVDTLYLEDITPGEIDEKAPLVGGDLGIDSIDILELVMMVEQDYGVVIDNKEVGEKVFASVAALAEYIRDNRPQTADITG
ncbi:acyl carrier protein [Desulfosalsimonas propionicica]|uniref:Acyl carrier protein n=1 Tax=Desulfosalsimonas propionicica TaxID=332175 RepID=A0A7W0CBA9_9BACT|nr:phosphopantetheine-binding protein [Desulfosalsimonas propionicica]MBA2882599.1 acyl carrier protein [Desulfosalsimonas propionicica]